MLSETPEPVLLGTAMVAAVAAGLFGDLFAALDGMAPRQRVIAPDQIWKRAHAISYGIYRTLFAVRNDVEASAAALRALCPPPGS